MSERLRRFLIRLLGGVIREPHRVEVVPPDLLKGLRLVDGLLAQGSTKQAAAQLRVILIRWRQPDAR